MERSRLLVTDAAELPLRQSTGSLIMTLGMKAKTHNAAWYGIGVYASLIVTFLMRDDRESGQPNKPSLYFMTALWALVLSLLYLGYGSISTRIRPLTIDRTSRVFPFSVGILYAPLLYGIGSVVMFLMDLVGYRSDPGHDKTWGGSFPLILFVIPMLCFELNRIKIKNNLKD